MVCRLLWPRAGVWSLCQSLGHWRSLCAGAFVGIRGRGLMQRGEYIDPEVQEFGLAWHRFPFFVAKAGRFRSVHRVVQGFCPKRVPKGAPSYIWSAKAMAPAEPILVFVLPEHNQTGYEQKRRTPDL